MKKFVWALAVALGCGAAWAREPARLIEGTETELPRLATANGTFKLGKKPYPEGTREQWIREGRVLGRAP